MTDVQLVFLVVADDEATAQRVAEFLAEEGCVAESATRANLHAMEPLVTPSHLLLVETRSWTDEASVLATVQHSNTCAVITPGVVTGAAVVEPWTTSLTSAVRRAVARAEIRAQWGTTVMPPSIPPPLPSQFPSEHPTAGGSRASWGIPRAPAVPRAHGHEEWFRSASRIPPSEPYPLVPSVAAGEFEEERRESYPSLMALSRANLGSPDLDLADLVDTLPDEPASDSVLPSPQFQTPPPPKRSYVGSLVRRASEEETESFSADERSGIRRTRGVSPELDQLVAAARR